MDLIDYEFIKNWPFTSFDLPEGVVEGQRKIYKRLMKDGAKTAKKVIKDYVNSVIDTKLKKYLDEIGNNKGIDKDTGHIFELFSVFLGEIERRFNLPSDEKNKHYEEFEEIAEKHIKEFKKYINI